MSVLSGLFFKEMYDLLVGECQTVRINGVSVERGSTVLQPCDHLTHLEYHNTYYLERGELGGSEYRNTAKNNKYRIIAKKSPNTARRPKSMK